MRGSRDKITDALLLPETRSENSEEQGPHDDSEECNDGQENEEKPQAGSKRMEHATSLMAGQDFAKSYIGRVFETPVCTGRSGEEREVTKSGELDADKADVIGKAGFTGRRKAVCALPNATLGQQFVECFSAFAECL